MKRSFVFKHSYDELSDKEIIEQVVRPKEGCIPNEEGVSYLLYERYNPL